MCKSYLSKLNFEKFIRCLLDLEEVITFKGGEVLEGY